jgi:cytochrome c
MQGERKTNSYICIYDCIIDLILFSVLVSTREDRPLQFNRATIFAFLALALTGMAQAGGAGDPALGAAVYKKCQSCHQVGDQAKNRVGPQLNDIFGRTAGGLEGAKYSKSMMRAGQDGLIWSEETLDKFLETPKSLVAKTRMSFGASRMQKTGQI